jgi:hypothetical protein
MPRRLRRWARSVLQKRGPQSVSAERPRPDAALLIDLTSPREAAGKALSVAGAGADAAQPPVEAGAAGGAPAAGRGAVRPGASLAERKQAWAERELAIRSSPTFKLPIACVSPGVMGWGKLGAGEGDRLAGACAPLRQSSASDTIHQQGRLCSLHRLLRMERGSADTLVWDGLGFVAGICRRQLEERKSRQKEVAFAPLPPHWPQNSKQATKPASKPTSWPAHSFHSGRV